MGRSLRKWGNPIVFLLFFGPISPCPQCFYGILWLIRSKGEKVDQQGSSLSWLTDIFKRSQLDTFYSDEVLCLLVTTTQPSQEFDSSAWWGAVSVLRWYSRAVKEFPGSRAKPVFNTSAGKPSTRMFLSFVVFHFHPQPGFTLPWLITFFLHPWVFLYQWLSVSIILKAFLVVISWDGVLIRSQGYY